MAVKARVYGLPKGQQGALTEHESEADAHHAWPLTETDIPPAIARDSEVTTAITTHVASAAKHITVSATPPGSPAVDDLWLDIS